MVVMLDVSNDMTLQVWRDELRYQIGEDAIENELTPPHITLFKAGDTGEEAPFSITEQQLDTLVRTCEDAQPPSTLTITDVVQAPW